MIYQNQASAVQQTIFNGGKWKDSLVYSASNPPADNTRLSIFTQYSQKSGFTSRAVYQFNRSLVMVDVRPGNNLAKDPHVNYDFLSTVNELQELTFVDIGFACIIDQKVPGNMSQLFFQCCMGNDASSTGYEGLSSGPLTQMSFEYSIYSEAHVSNASSYVQDELGE
jgi:hypothetical protein